MSEAVRGIIEFYLKKTGLVETKDHLEKIATASRRTSKEIGLLRDSVNRAGSALANVFAAGVIGRFLGDSLKQFAALERHLNVIAVKLEQFGQGGAEAARRVRDELMAIAKSGGPALSETLPIFNKLLSVTKDAAEAMYLTKLAADASESGYIEAGAAADALSNILQGKAKGAAQALGLELVKTNGQQKTNAELMEEAIGLMEGWGDAFSDTQNTLDSFGAQWEEFKLAVGEGVAKAFELIGGLDGVTKVLKSLGPIAVKTGYEIAGFFVGLGSAAKASADLGEIARSGMGGYVAGIKTAYRAGLAAFSAEIEGAREELDKLWEDAGTSAGLSQEEGRQKAIEQARRKAIADDEREAAAEAERARERAAKVAAAEQDAFIALQQQKASVAAAGSYERLQAELEVSELRMRKELENTELTEAAKQAIRERYMLADQETINAFITANFEKEVEAYTAREQLDREYAQRWSQLQIELADSAAQRREAELAALDEKYALEYLKAVQAGANLLALFQVWAAARLEIDRRYAEAEAKIEEAKAKQKAMLYMTGARMAIGALQTLFGENKQLAIAEALINTYEAITKALTLPFPMNFIVAALVGAAGFKQVRNIQQSEPGSSGSGASLGGGGKKGFDDPVNDRLAYQGGRRWASDYIRETSRGMADGMRMGNPIGAAQQTITTTTYDQSTGQVIHVHGAFIDSDSLRTLGRKLKQVERTDAARFQR